MALRKPATETPVDHTAAEKAVQTQTFEQMEGADADTGQPDQASTDSQPAAASASATAAPHAPAPEPTSSPVRAVTAASRASGAVTAFSSKSIYDELQNQITVEMLEGMGYGSFPRITVNAGGTLVVDKTKPLGDIVEFFLESWNFVTMVVTGEQNNKEADKLIRSSFDGMNLADGSGTIEEYVKELKTDGYSKTVTKKYVELYGVVTAQTHKGVKTVVPEEEQSLYQVSVSPQSVKNWGRFQFESRRRGFRGVKDSQAIIMAGEATELNGKMFGVINFSADRTASAKAAA